MANGEQSIRNPTKKYSVHMDGISRRRSRIYKAFYSDSLFSLIEWSLKALHKSNLDHKPLSMAKEDINWGPKPFRVFKILMNNGNSIKIIKEKLNKGPG